MRCASWRASAAARFLARGRTCGRVHLCPCSGGQPHAHVALGALRLCTLTCADARVPGFGRYWLLIAHRIQRRETNGCPRRASSGVLPRAGRAGGHWMGCCCSDSHGSLLGLLGGGLGGGGLGGGGLGGGARNYRLHVSTWKNMLCVAPAARALPVHAPKSRGRPKKWSLHPCRGAWDGKRGAIGGIPRRQAWDCCRPPSLLLRPTSAPRTRAWKMHMPVSCSVKPMKPSTFSAWHRRVLVTKDAMALWGQTRGPATVSVPALAPPLPAQAGAADASRGSRAP